MTDPALPGLAKVRRVAATTRRVLDLIGVREGWFSSIVESADIVSEGAVQTVDGVDGYYGSTSLRCALANEAEGDPHALADLVISDPNTRLRLLRLAHREAVSRADARPLGVLTAEITATVSAENRVLAIDIDVSAGLLDEHLDDTKIG